MSILIKGMDMPKSCYSCNFCQYYAEPNQGCYCLALFVDLHRTNFVKERLANCPLIEVPKHGRLIDADALKYRIVNIGGFMGCQEVDDYVKCVFDSDIDDAPTIIESEE